MEKIHELLASATKSTKTADRLNANGKTTQANNQLKKAEESLANANTLFHTNQMDFSNDEINSLSQQELNAIKSKSLSSLTDMNSDTAQLEKKVKTYKRYVNEITTVVEEAIPYVENPTQKEKLENVIKKRKRNAV